MLRKILYTMFALAFFTMPAQSEGFTEGFEYQAISSPFPTNSEKGKVEVIEVFWYGCPHCYSLEPAIRSWNTPDYIDFRLMPAISAKGWAATGAQAFYTASALGVLDRAHTALFDAIHRDKRTELISDPEAIADFFSEFGVSEDKFYGAWNSFSVDANLKQATNTFMRSGITGVPSVIINGRYLTSPSMAGGTEQMMQVIEYVARTELGK
jgi:protein dithiol oxidoreductase (disulfide-forming)